MKPALLAALLLALLAPHHAQPRQTCPGPFTHSGYLIRCLPD